MAYSWKIELNGLDITAKVSRFEITARLDQYCREVSLDLADPALFSLSDFATIPSDPVLEIFTDTGSGWVSQGKFFVERPLFSNSLNVSVISGLWGRSETARLGPPFAGQISFQVETDRMFFDVVADLCSECGVTFDPLLCLADDFLIFAETYEASESYPIDIITELAELAGYMVTTNREGRLIIAAPDYAPAVPDVTITDADIANLETGVEWPEFGNRVRVTAQGGAGNYSINLVVPDPCLPADGSAMAKVYARVTDQDGAPVNNIPVTWSLAKGIASLSSNTTLTGTIMVYDEEVRAQSFTDIRTAFPPSLVVGVWAYRDTPKAVNFAADGYTVNGNLITLATPLKYCDQLVKVTYAMEGAAMVHVVAGFTPGDEEIIASVEGMEARSEVHIDNPCQCPPTLRLMAQPGSINVGETAALLVYAEEGGAPVTTGRAVYMSEATTPGHGKLQWDVANLGKVNVTGDKAYARNDVSGVTQCDLSMWPDSVAGVWMADADGKKMGSNLYASHAGKVVNLTASLPTGTELVVDYTVIGAAVNTYAGDVYGTARINAFMPHNREEPLEATATISIMNKTDAYSADDVPAGWSPGDDGVSPGGSGGSSGGFDFDSSGGCLVETDPWTVIECPEDKVCCQHKTTGDWGCHDWEDCMDSQGMPDCFAENVMGNPNDANLQARFGEALQKGCTCQQICENELNIFGTTQSYDGASYRTIAQIVSEDHGLSTTDGEAYWSKVEELTQEALATCRKECGDCELSEPPVLSGPDAVTKPGEYSYTASGGLGVLVFRVSGESSGISINKNGVVTLTEEACGSFTVSVMDDCGFSDSIDVRITNAGQWVFVERKGDCTVSNPYTGTCVVGKYLHEISMQLITTQECIITDDCPDDTILCNKYGLYCLTKAEHKSTNHFDVYRQNTYEWRC